MLTNILDYLRIALYGTLVILIFMLYQAWEQDHPKSIKSTTDTTTTTNAVIPETTGALKSVVPPTQITTSPSTTAVTKANIIHVKTNFLQADIDEAGGNIIQVKLLKYSDELNSKNPYLLLNNLPDTRYIAQSGLLSSEGPDTSNGQAVYTSEQTEYSLPDNQNEIKVNLHWQNQQGIKITKTFIFQRNNYEIGVNYSIENQSKQPWDGNLYLQLMRKNTPPVNHQSFVNFATYFGAAISSPEKKFQKITFKEMDNSNVNQTITNGWAAMIQHYFVSAWIPDKNTSLQYFSKVTNDGLYTIGMLGPKLDVLPGQTMQTQAKFYTGPAIADEMEKASPTLKLTIDYGWFWFISAIIFWMMQQIYNFVGNWGWSIVIVTIIIKLMFYHLSAKSYRSMSALKKLQPKMNALKERFGEDKQKFTQATLELYKKEKVNPMSGCLPILVQIPVFIGLYWVLIESVQLRHAPFILWIHDLSTKDPYYVLPLLMGLSMFLQQRLNPPPADPVQAKVMMLMPIIFTVLFINFPAGLMLYWFVNNTLSFLQQWYIMHSMDKAIPPKKTN